ncbi:two-component system, chemotaxis family, response regulator CheB [Jatrophihabitans endophyticus]|uniref:Protein-glutamate methylesterase/protein-glutamine glutaminase n=1 Tax=Jatrophihabitans endophyticus TaxID=1206085 RepID=A0A1M5II10_9ACTN|nr:chemotaxis response regulator protein-glutamate methylesterase [Jatrophihabitans endophyticus]SHG28004.1 two-component system, chemotaxis family, response regulator CheB [Jatrophihabitans endophyticus]
MTASRRIRVLVVDDSIVVRKIVTDVLSQDPHIDVVGTAVNGRVGLTKIAQLEPDLVTLDVEMPEMDGLSALKAIREKWARLPVIMFSTLTEPGAAVALEALSLGASDYVTKPANVGSVSESMASVRDQLIPRVHALAGRAAGITRGTTPPPPPRGVAPRPATGSPVASAPRTIGRQVGHVAAAPRSGPRATSAPKILAIGCSTGGPQALTGVLQALPGSFPLPIVVVQHMPPVFTAQFAARLDRTCQLTVVEAKGGESLRPGTVYIAPGDYHMELAAAGAKAPPVTTLNQGPPVCFCRPAVDVLFQSVAAQYGAGTLAVVLTGMGHDGRTGAGRIRDVGGSVLVQDEQSSVVWGMPGAIAAAGLADEILPLDSIAGAIRTRVSASPTLAGAR